MPSRTDCVPIGPANLDFKSSVRVRFPPPPPNELLRITSISVAPAELCLARLERTFTPAAYPQCPTKPP